MVAVTYKVKVMYKLKFYITQDPVANNTLQTFKVSFYCFNDTPAKTTKTAPRYRQVYIYTMWPELTQELFTANEAVDSCKGHAVSLRESP